MYTKSVIGLDALMPKACNEQMALEKLVDHIIIHQDDVEDGCPLIFLYSFIEKENLTTRWLYRALDSLWIERAIIKPKPKHYRVIAGRSQVEKAVSRAFNGIVQRFSPIRYCALR